MMAALRALRCSVDHGLRMLPACTCRDACILCLSNGFAIGCLISIILHLLLPEESDPNDPDAPIKDPQVIISVFARRKHA